MLFYVGRIRIPNIVRRNRKNAGLKITFKGIPSEDISQIGNNKSHSHGNTTEVSSDPLYITCHIWKRTG